MVYMLIDCDTGIDDSIAILFALKRKDVRVVGMTTGCGNTTAEQAAENCIRLIKLANPGYEIPVAVGTNKQTVGEWGGPVPEIHGYNGIGDVELPPSDQKPVSEGAAEMIVRLAKEYAGELTICPLGRMTNLYNALQLEPNLPKLVKNVVCMGGAVFTTGNINPTAEANIGADPEASDAVLMAGFDFTMVGMDVTMKTHLHKRYLDIIQEKYVADDCKGILEYMQGALKLYFNFNRKQSNFLDYCPVHDPMAILCAVEPTYFTFRRIRIRVETEGKFTRGQVVRGTGNHKLLEAPFSWVAVDADGDACVELILSAFTKD